MMNKAGVVPLALTVTVTPSAAIRGIGRQQAKTA
jgi:hypothetical protein